MAILKRLTLQYEEIKNRNYEKKRDISYKKKLGIKDFLFNAPLKTDVIRAALICY